MSAPENNATKLKHICNGYTIILIVLQIYWVVTKLILDSRNILPDIVCITLMIFLWFAIVDTLSSYDHSHKVIKIFVKTISAFTWFIIYYYMMRNDYRESLQLILIFEILWSFSLEEIIFARYFSTMQS